MITSSSDRNGRGPSDGLWWCCLSLFSPHRELRVERDVSRLPIESTGGLWEHNADIAAPPVGAKHAGLVARRVEVKISSGKEQTVASWMNAVAYQGEVAASLHGAAN